MDEAGDVHAAIDGWNYHLQALAAEDIKKG